jgi:hypothetical protein
VAPGHGFRFLSRRFAVASTTISLGLRLGPGARVRTAKGGSTSTPAQQSKARFHAMRRGAGDRRQGLTAAHDVGLQGQKAQAYPVRRRRGGDRAPAPGQPPGCGTTAFHLAAATVAAISQPSWPIELVFKAVTQPLKSKTFSGISTNAVMPQGWVALITSLLLARLRFQAGLGLPSPQGPRLLPINPCDRRTLVDRGTPQRENAAGGQPRYLVQA